MGRGPCVKILGVTWRDEANWGHFLEVGAVDGEDAFITSARPMKRILYHFQQHGMHLQDRTGQEPGPTCFSKRSLVVLVRSWIARSSSTKASLWEHFTQTHSLAEPVNLCLERILARIACALRSRKGMKVVCKCRCVDRKNLERNSLCSSIA